MISHLLRIFLYFFLILILSIYFLESYFINNQFYKTNIQEKSIVIQKNYQKILKISYRFLKQADYQPENFNIHLLKNTYPIFKDFSAWNLDWLPLNVEEKMKNISRENRSQFFIWNKDYFALSISLKEFQKPYLIIFLLDKKSFQSTQDSLKETYYPVSFKGKKLNSYFIQSKENLYSKFIPNRLSKSSSVSRILSFQFFAYIYNNFNSYDFLVLTEDKNRFFLYATLSFVLSFLIFIDLGALLLKSFWVKGFVYGEIIKDTFENKSINLRKKHLEEKLVQKKLFQEEFKNFNFGENILKIGEKNSKFDVILPPELLSQKYITPKQIRDYGQFAEDQIEKKRKSIFNVELMSLIENITSDKRNKQKEETYPSFWKEKEDGYLEFLNKFPDKEKSQLSDIIYNIYESNVSLKLGMERYFNILLKKEGMEKFSLNLYKKNIGYYYPILVSNIHEYTTKNFIFSVKELNYNKKNIYVIDLNQNKNPFFSKKIHTADLEDSKYIIAFPLFDYYKLFLFCSSELNYQKINDLKKRLENALYPIYPFLYKKNQEENKAEMKSKDPNSYLLQELNYIKNATNFGKKPIYVTTIQLNEDIEYDKIQNLNLKIEIELEEDELSYSKSYDTIVILSKFHPEKIIKKVIQPLNINYNAKTQKYPSQGNNHFCYL